MTEPLAEPRLRLPTDVFDLLRQMRGPFETRPPLLGRVVIGPAPFHQHCARQSLPLFVSLPRHAAAGLLAGYPPEPGHKLVRVFKAGDIASSLDYHRPDDCMHAAQRAWCIDDKGETPGLEGFIDGPVQRGDAGLRLVDRPLQLLEG